MEIGAVLEVLGSWGILVLIGSMGFTELVKRQAKRAKAGVPWHVWVVLPSILAFVGILGMVIGGIILPQMALLVWFVVSFSGPLLYKFAIRPALVKMGMK